MATSNATEGAVRKKRGPYKLYSLNPKDASYNATIPQTTKWRRLRCECGRDVLSFEENQDHQNKTTALNEELQSPCSSSSSPFFLENENQDCSGANLTYYTATWFINAIHSKFQSVESTPF